MAPKKKLKMFHFLAACVEEGRIRPILWNVSVKSNTKYRAADAAKAELESKGFTVGDMVDVPYLGRSKENWR